MSETLRNALEWLELRLKEEIVAVGAGTDEDDSYEYVCRLLNEDEGFESTEDRIQLLNILDDTDTYPTLRDAYFAMLDYIYNTGR